MPGPPIIGDKAWWKFLKIRPICPDINSMFWPNMFGPNLTFGEFSNFVRMPHQASKKRVRISQKKRLFYLFYQVLCTKKSLSTYPVSISCPTSTFLANCYNSFDCHQYILKFSPQLIEDLEMFVIEGEHSAILTECFSHPILDWSSDMSTRTGFWIVRVICWTSYLTPTRNLSEQDEQICYKFNSNKK